MNKLAKVSAAQVNKHLKVVDVFRALDPTMPIGQVKMFLEAAKNEQSTLSELAERSGLALATASHYLTNMMVMDRYKKKGLDVLDAYENPMNRRQKLVVLTENGRKLIDQLNGG